MWGAVILLYIGLGTPDAQMLVVAPTPVYESKYACEAMTLEFLGGYLAGMLPPDTRATFSCGRRRDT